MLDEQKVSKNCNKKVLVENEKNIVRVLPDIDCQNYKAVFKDFLQNFTAESSESPKYQMVAIQIMNKIYNMFHVHLEDIKKFNCNLGRFVSKNKSLDAEITRIVQ